MSPRGFPQHIFDARFSAQVLLNPNGDHRLEIETAMGEASLTRDQVRRLKDAIAEFERETAFDDGQSRERLRPHRVAIVERGR